MWWQAICLILVLEGAALALFPNHLRDAAEMLTQMDNRTLRLFGLAALFLGAGLLTVL